MIALGDEIHQWKLSDGDLIGVRRFLLKDFLPTVAEFEGPILHIGSKASIIDRNDRWLKVFSGKRVVGLDVSEGKNVDIVFDISGNLKQFRRVSEINQYGTIICAHVLEHIQNPFRASENIYRLLKIGGRVFVTVPWVQGYHAFPEDYWRMSFAAVRALFPGLEWEYEFYSNPREDLGYQLTLNDKIEHSKRTCRIERNLFQFQIDSMPKQKMFSDRPGQKIELARHYMPGLSINMIGKKVARL